MQWPERIGRYRVEGVLGAGTFATVYKARDEALDVPVALKVLAQNWSYEPEVRARFVNEARLLRRADGTRVVRVHDIGQTDEGQPYFVMDFADRGTIEDRAAALAAAGRALTVEDVGRLARFLAAGVAEVHRLGVVHRDLKPSNLLLRSERAAAAAGDEVGTALVGADERLVVSDLGLARDLMGPTRLTAAVGTPGFMAPEQLDPSARLDERTDVFACTAILHAVLTGTPPAGPVSPGDADLAGLPAAVRDLLARGLAARPDDRFAGVEQWLAAVEAALDVAGAAEEWTGVPATPFARALSSLGRAAPRGARSWADIAPVSLGPPSTAPGRPRRRGVVAVATGAAVALAAVVVAAVVNGGDGRGGGSSTTTIAGRPAALPGVDEARAVDERLIDPVDIAVGSDGTVFVAELTANRLRRIDTEGVVSTIAGESTPGFAGDGDAATDARLYFPHGIATTDDGALLIADWFNGRIRRVAPDGTITSIAGNGESGAAAPGTLATQAPLSPKDVAVGPGGEVYVSDEASYRVWVVDREGVLQAFAGSGQPGYDGDGGSATEARLEEPGGLAVGPDGSVYVSDMAAAVVRRIDVEGTITTVAGTGEAGFGGDGGPATEARLDGPGGIAVGGDGSFYIADRGNRRVRRVDAEGVIDTVAGTAVDYSVEAGEGSPGDGGPATAAPLAGPSAVALDAGGRLLVVDGYGNRVRVVDADGTLGTLAGNGPPGEFGDGGPATEAVLANPLGLAVDGDGNLYVGEGFTGRVRRVDPDGVITTIAGLGDGGGGLTLGATEGSALAAEIPGAEGVAVDAAGTVYFTSIVDSLLRGVTTDGWLVVVAGTGAAGFSGDGGPPSAAQLDTPTGVAAGVDAVIVADSANHRVRSITTDGTITTLAGSGSVADDGGRTGPAAAANLQMPMGVAFGPGGSVYVTEQVGNRVRRVDPDGTVTLVAGTGAPGSGGDGGPATAATLNGPAGVAVDGDGNAYVAEMAGHRVRRIDPDGTITTVAGTGRAGFGGDGGPGDEALLSEPRWLAVGPDGELYVGDTGNHRVRRVDPDGTITTVAGAY